MPTTRVNIHPRPDSDDWDTSIPYHGNSYNQSQHVLDAYLNQFLDQVPTDHHVVLISNGAPISRQIAVKNIIGSRYASIEIEPSHDYSNHDPIFSNHYITIGKPQRFDDIGLLEFYLEHWPEMTEFSHRYEFASHSRDHGYFHAVQRRWYQWGELMPDPPDEIHQQMYMMFGDLFSQTADMLVEVLEPISWSRERIREGLMFRLNHNPLGSDRDGLLVNRHGDNSIVTMWMAQTHSGAEIDFGQEAPIDPTPIDYLYNISEGVMIFPGFDYCDIGRTATPATWHRVKDTGLNEHRVSLVAFLKHP